MATIVTADTEFMPTFRWRRRRRYNAIIFILLNSYYHSYYYTVVIIIIIIIIITKHNGTTRAGVVCGGLQRAAMTLWTHSSAATIKISSVDPAMADIKYVSMYRDVFVTTRFDGTIYYFVLPFLYLIVINKANL